MNKGEIETLAARVEALEGPDREVDVRTQLAVFGDKRYGIKGHPANPVPGTLSEYYQAYADVIHVDDAIDDDAVGRFTASIDAAMGLVPAESFWRVGHDAYDPSGFTAQASYDRGEGRLGFTTGTGYTPATALTAAALRAIASTMEDDRG